MLHLSGMKLEQVCVLSEMSKNAVAGAIRAYQAGGWEAVAVQKHRGPKKGEGSLLEQEQQQEIRALIHDHTPDQLDLPFALWSRAAVTALIRQRYGITLAVRTIGKYLQRWGFTPQKPLNKAYEQNLAAVRKWLDHDYPAIARRAKVEDAEIYWGDETGLRSDDVRGRSYARRGHTPVVRPCHRRERLGLISAVTNRGAVRWMVLKKAIRAPELIEFMRRLAREAQRKVFLILDNLPVHKQKPVTAWLDRHRDRIEVFHLPSYSPELNPDEMLNADLKEALTKKAPTRHKGELKKALTSHLRKVSRQPDRVKKYFQNAPVKYAA
jgi:transposase